MIERGAEAERNERVREKAEREEWKWEERVEVGKRDGERGRAAQLVHSSCHCSVIDVACSVTPLCALRSL